MAPSPLVCPCPGGNLSLLPASLLSSGYCPRSWSALALLPRVVLMESGQHLIGNTWVPGAWRCPAFPAVVQSWVSFFSFVPTAISPPLFPIYQALLHGEKGISGALLQCRYLCLCYHCFYAWHICSFLGNLCHQWIFIIFLRNLRCKGLSFLLWQLYVVQLSHTYHFIDHNFFGSLIPLFPHKLIQNSLKALLALKRLIYCTL